MKDTNFKKKTKRKERKKKVKQKEISNLKIGKKQERKKIKYNEERTKKWNKVEQQNVKERETTNRRRKNAKLILTIKQMRAFVDILSVEFRSGSSV